MISFFKGVYNILISLLVLIGKIAAVFLLIGGLVYGAVLLVQSFRKKERVEPSEKQPKEQVIVKREGACIPNEDARSILNLLERINDMNK